MRGPRVLVPVVVIGAVAGVGAVAVLARLASRDRSDSAAPISASVWSSGSRGIRFSGRGSHPSYVGSKRYNGYNGYPAGGVDSVPSTGDGGPACGPTGDC